MENTFENTDGTLVVDIDGTLCEIKTASLSYTELVPKQPVIEKLKELDVTGVIFKPYDIDRVLDVIHSMQEGQTIFLSL